MTDDPIDQLIDEEIERRKADGEQFEEQSEETLRAQEALIDEIPDFAIRVKQHLENSEWDELFAYFEENASTIDSRLEELNGSAGLGAGDMLDELAERYPEWFAELAQQKCGNAVCFALATRPRITRAAGVLLNPPPPLPDLDSDQQTPLPPLADSDVPPPPDPQVLYVRDMLRANNLEGFFSFLVQDPANLRLVNSNEIGDALDSAVAADPDYCEQALTWLIGQPGFGDARQVFFDRPAIRAELKGKQRESVHPTDAAPTEAVDLPPLPDNSDEWAQYVRKGLEGLDETKYAMLNEQRGNIALLMTVMDSYPDLGATFDHFVQNKPEQFAGWVQHYPEVESAVRTRPAVAAALDAHSKADVPPSAGDASRAVIGYAASNDFEGLFNYLLKAPRHAQAIIDSLDDSAGPLLDALVSQNGQTFVAWLDWCSDAEVQLALLSRAEISQTVDAVRTLQQPGRRDRTVSMAETELPGIRPEDDAEPLDAAPEDVLGQVSGPRIDFSDPAAETLAEAVRDLRKIVNANNLPNTFLELSVRLADGLGPGLSTNLGADWWRQLEGMARAQPSNFAKTLAAQGAPLVDEFLQDNSPTLDALLRDQRRTAQFIEVTDALKASVDSENEGFVKNTLQNGGVADWVAGGVLVLIGPGHDSDAQRYVNQQQDRVSGKVQVRKGSTFRGAGALTFSDCPPAKQGMVIAAVKRFSSKKVVFEAVEAGPVRQRPGRRRR